MVKVVNKIRIMDVPPVPPTAEEIVLLREIRDSLKNNL
jgi:large conductance mechanosensitive channel